VEFIWASGGVNPDRREQLLGRLAAWAGRLRSANLPRRAAFNGRRQPSLLENAQLACVLDRAGWPTHAELEAFARARVEEGGLGLEHWYAADHRRFQRILAAVIGSVVVILLLLARGLSGFLDPSHSIGPRQRGKRAGSGEPAHLGSPFVTAAS
jgi:hypothetical protein